MGARKSKIVGIPVKEGRKQKKPHQAQPAAKYGWEPPAGEDAAEGLSCDNVNVSRRNSKASSASGGWVSSRRSNQPRRGSGASSTSGGASGRWKSGRPMSASDARSLMAGARSTEGDKASVSQLGPWIGQAAAAQVATSRRGHSRLKVHAQAEVLAPPSFQPGQAAAAQSAMRRRTKPSLSAPPRELKADVDVVRARIKEAKAALLAEEAKAALLAEVESCAKEEPTPSTSPPSSPGSPTASRARAFVRSGTGDTIISLDGAHSRSGHRCSRWCDDFAKHYQVGEQVMPSTHKEVQVRHAVGKVGCHPGLEGCDVVIKVRYKNQRASEEAWKASNERMLNLPACGGIARVYDVLEDHDAYYVVMEKVGGKDLRETLSTEGRMVVEEVKEVLRQLLQGVAELHSSGCIHKDIKLENVMLDRPEGSCSPSSLRPTPRPGGLERGPSVNSLGVSPRPGGLERGPSVSSLGVSPRPGGLERGPSVNSLGVSPRPGGLERGPSANSLGVSPRPGGLERGPSVNSLGVSPRPVDSCTSSARLIPRPTDSCNSMHSFRHSRPQTPVTCATDTGPSAAGGMKLLDLPGAALASAAASTSLTERSASATVVVKLVDFDTLQEWTPQTPKAQDVLGTDQYIAPEAYEGRYSRASDIFAVGVCAYKLLTGHFPFRSCIFNDKPGENWVGSPKMHEIRARLCEEKVDWSHPAFLKENGPQPVIARMLAVDDRQRPTAREVLADPWLATRSSVASLSTLWVPLGLVP